MFDGGATKDDHSKTSLTKSGRRSTWPGFAGFGLQLLAAYRVSINVAGAWDEGDGLQQKL